MVKILQYPDYYANRLLYADRSNYHGPRNGKASWLAIHTVQGSYSSCVNWFRNGAANVSAHYVVSSKGHVTQMVGENMIAWHIGQHNAYTIGIEHEGYAHDGHPPTKAMYHASAKIAAGICRRHDIPVSRILGHRDFRNQSHTDPGNEWDMAYYRKLVANYMRKGTPAKPAPKADKPPVQSEVVWKVLVGAFSNRSYADATASLLKAKGFGAYVYLNNSLYRVQAAALSDEMAADELVQKLKAAGWRDAYALAEKS